MSPRRPADANPLPMPDCAYALPSQGALTTEAIKKKKAVVPKKKVPTSSPKASAYRKAMAGESFCKHFFICAAVQCISEPGLWW